VIRADRRAEPAVDHGEVGREERMVDRDPIRRPARPAPLTAEPEPAVAETGLFEKPGEKRRAIGRIEVADDQRS
jgi:hypothetical protein